MNKFLSVIFEWPTESAGCNGTGEKKGPNTFSY